MKTVLNILCAIMLLCSFSACRNVKCPDLDKNILSWFPYEEESVLHFENKTTDALLTIPIDYVGVNHTSHYSIGSKCGDCSDEIHIGGSSVEFNIFVYIRENKIQSEHYNINGESFYENAIILENYTFNNKEYEKVKIFENSASNGKLIVARNFGIVGFVDKEANEWVLQESSAKPQAKPNITNSSCGEP